MNLLKEIAPYREQIENNSKGHGFSNSKDLQKVADVWHKWLIQSDENIYPNNAAQKPTDMTCKSCKKKLLQLTWAWINILEGREENKPKKYKAIKEERKPWNFCETPNEKCTANYCDENGCLNRKRSPVEPTELGESIEEIVDKGNEELKENTEIPKFDPLDKIGKEDYLNQLKMKCDALGIKYHHAAGIKRLTELLK